MKSKQNLIARVFMGIQIIVFALLLASCGSTKNLADDAESLGDFTKRELSNGIPVIYKQNRGSKIIVFRIVLEGGTSVLDQSVSGLEDLTLDLIFRGSNDYPYEKIQQLEYEKSFSLTAQSGRDYSTVGFMCIQRDLADVLALFADCFLHPAFLESDFRQKMSEASAAIASKKADPSGALGLAISKAVFTGHPYGTASSVTEESYPNISLDLVKGTHTSLLNALRMKIVIIGNFNIDFVNDFTSSLETIFKEVPKQPFSQPKIPKIPLSGEKVLVENAQAGDTGYIAGLFQAPAREDEDYIPFALATMYLDDLFFANVREKAGAVYSIGTGVIGGKELLGVISVYKATEKKTLKKVICDAIKEFDGTALHRTLDQYKNKYISSIYSSAQTSSGLASTIISSMEYHGSESAYQERAKMVKSVETKQVIAAYKKYIDPIAKQDAALWVVVDSEENLDDYDF